MKQDCRTPENPAWWRDQPLDEDHARRPFPTKGKFIAHMRATGRPTTRDLRQLKALKKTPGGEPGLE